MTEIIPAVLAHTEKELGERVALLPTEANFIHLDVLEEDVWMNTTRLFEAHLMVKEPEKIIKKWIDRGAKRIIVHETSPEILKYRAKVEIGLEIEMQEILKKEFTQIHNVDFVHIMSIDKIGEQGHPLNEKIFDRIKEVRKNFPDIVISVDGGINLFNYQALIEAGADRLVVGTRFNEIWSSQKKEQ